MFKFLTGVVFGIVLATVGLTGLFVMGDKLITKGVEITKEAAK
jgi:hypothetical protein